MDDTNDYEVGYGRPPKTTQFLKGRSGNPKGRPKGSKNLSSMLAEISSRHVTITESGRTRTVQLQEAVLIQMAAGAAKGDRHCRRDFLQLTSSSEAREQSEESTSTPHERDKAVLEAFMKRLSRAHDTFSEPNDTQPTAPSTKETL